MARIPDPAAVESRPSLGISGGGISAAKPSGNIPNLSAAATGVMQLAKGLQDVSTDVATVFTREQDRTDTLMAEDALNKLKSDQMELTLGEDGFTKQVGENAINKPVIRDWTSKFDQRASQIGETLGNEHQKEMFQHRANIQRGTFQADLYRHVAVEKDKYAQTVLKSTIDTEVRAVGLSPQDDVAFRMSVDRVNAAQDLEGDRLGNVGKRKMLTESEKAKSLDLLWTARLDAWRLQDPRGAMQAYQDNALQISPDARRRIEEALFRDSAPVLAAGLNFAGGPPVPANALVNAAKRDFDSNFNTVLTPKEEEDFQKWKQRYAPNDTGVDYDLRGAFKAGVKPAGPEAGKDEGHFPDTFKKPNHPTFSNESRYAPFGKPGRWEGDKFIPNQEEPRGIRNNNPGNIIQGSTKWDGQIDGSDPKYVSFGTPEAGIRAMARNLAAYGGKGIDTVSTIVSRWAPATENDTAKYIEFVSKKMGVNPTEPLDLRDRKVMSSLVVAMIEQENGKNPYSNETVSAGIESALTGKQLAYEATRSSSYNLASLANLSPSDVMNVVTGDPVIDRLPMDQKLRVFQMAREQSHQGMTQLRDAMKQRLLDSTAAYEAGKDAPGAPTRSELIATFGQLDGERFHGDLELSRQFGEDVKNVQTLPATQQAALVAARTPVPGPGFAVAERRHEMLARAVDQVTKQREQDPALAVLRGSPQVTTAYQAFATQRGQGVDATAAAQAYASATLAEQQRLQIRDPQILTKDMVDGMARQFASPPAAGENLANVMRGMVDTWGKYWPQVGRQVQDKLPPEAVIIGLGVSSEAEIRLSEAAKLKSGVLSEGIPHDKVTTLGEHITKELKPLHDTVVHQRGGMETYNNYADSAKKIALMLMQGGESPKGAAQKAVASIAGKRDNGGVFDPFVFEGTWRVPQSQLGGDTSVNSLHWGAEALRTDIGSDKPAVGEVQSLMLPRKPAAVRDEDAMKQWRRDIASNGFWVTSPGDGGLTLYMPAGLGSEPVLDGLGNPVRRSWKQISDVGNSVRAAHMSDVYKKGVRQP